MPDQFDIVIKRFFFLSNNIKIECIFLDKNFQCIKVVPNLNPKNYNHEKDILFYDL